MSSVNPSDPNLSSPLHWGDGGGHGGGASGEVGAMRFDVAVSRMVDGVASRADVSVIDAEELARPGAWRQVALSQRLDAALVAEVGFVVASADRAGLVVADEGVGRLKDGVDAASQRFRRRVGLGAAWAGWAAAAVVALSAFGPGSGVKDSGGSVNTATAPILSAAEALSDYLSKGRNNGTVIGELPKKVLVDTSPAADGKGYEVIYIRQIMERAHVDDLYRFSSDELGNPTPTKVRMSKPANAPL